MEAILEQGLPYVSGPQWLGEQVLRGQHVLAVAGTHGKTTTSSMLAWILEYAGLAPNFLIGGVAPGLKVSARLNPGQRHFVIEADEYDTAFFDKRSKFVHYRPRTAILNNLEYDHADIFPDLAAIETQFHHLLRTVPASGLVLRPTQSEALDRVLARGCWTPVQYFGAGGQWQARALPDGLGFEVYADASACGPSRAQTGMQAASPAPDLPEASLRHAGTVRWALTGEHNRMNALAAIAAAAHVGVSPETAIEALSAFEGVKRRMELRGTINGIEVYDDFAHHPTAIATTLQGLRSRKQGGRIIAVLEPRSNTMKLGAMAARLPGALEQADLVFCYGETHGKHALGWDPSQVLAPLGERATAHTDLDKMVVAIRKAARPSDSILVMSNGGFGGIHQKLLDALAMADEHART
jgi:UDP-N-acetylmuramate: L-alanyl-gamma-D-glutamyl-meso-diaminopimelate ligase